MKKPRTRHVANTCELSGLSWKYRTDAADYINTFDNSRKLLLAWNTRFWIETFVNARHVKNTWSRSRNDKKVETDNPQYLPKQVRRQTEGQARADHGPAQQGIRVNLRQEPGSPGTRLKLVTSTKQKFYFEICKKRIRFGTILRLASEGNPAKTLGEQGFRGIPTERSGGSRKSVKRVISTNLCFCR